MIGRVSDRATFARLGAAQRVRRGPVSVAFVPAENGVSRVAYAVARPVGNAVARNRLRRRLRASVRGAEPLLRPGAYLVGAAPAAATLPAVELDALVSQLLAWVGPPA